MALDLEGASRARAWLGWLSIDCDAMRTDMRGRDLPAAPFASGPVLAPSTLRSLIGRVAAVDPVSRNVLVHQSQDQGIEAVRAGPGRDDYDQQKSVKRLG